MSRVSETMDLIDTINKTAERMTPYELKSDAVIAGLLADIAKSLAVIADELTFNGDKSEWYLDAYKKFENRCIKEAGEI